MGVGIFNCADFSFHVLCSSLIKVSHVPCDKKVPSMLGKRDEEHLPEVNVCRMHRALII